MEDKFESAEALNNAYKELGNEFEKCRQKLKELEMKEKQIEICEICKKRNNCNHRELIHKDGCRVNDCDCFEAIPEDKQIEEMARVLCQNQCSSCTGATCLALLNCKALYEHGYRKIDEDSAVLTRGEHQKYCAYKIIEPQIKGCLDRERELEKTVENLKSENERLYKMKLDLENQLTQKGLTEYIGADEIEAEARKETAEKIIKMIKQTSVPVAVGKHANIKFIETSEEELNAIAKQFGVEIKE